MVVEDEISLLKVIAKRLKEEGYSVDTSKDGEEAKYFLQSYEYDCIILDIMLPFIDGLTLLKYIREIKIVTPVLLLTAKDTLKDKVEGLDSGADDYLVKPFEFDELLARIRVLIRRNLDTRVSTLSISDLTLDMLTHTIVRDGKTLELTAKEYSILEYLLKNKEIVLTRTQIADHVWDYDFDINSNIVDVYIRFIRAKIDDGFKNKLIHTVRGSGYVIKEKK